METCRWSYNLLVEVPLHNTKERLWRCSPRSLQYHWSSVANPKHLQQELAEFKVALPCGSACELWNLHIRQICMPRGANVLILAQLPAPVESMGDTSSLRLSFRSFMTWLTWCQPRWCCLVHGVFSLCIGGFQTNSWVQVYSFHCFQWQFSATDPAETPILSICSKRTITVQTTQKQCIQ